MTTEQKTAVQTALRGYVESFPSQRQAAVNLKKVSEATVVQVLSGNWELISDAMWRTIGKQVGVSNKEPWVMCQTRNYRTITAYIEDAKAFGNVYALIGPEGSGKTGTAEDCFKKMDNIFHVECAEHWNKKQFLAEILLKLGKENTGVRAGEMLELIVATLLRLDEPIIIIDECDKLNDSLLYFFITIYNKLKNSCGIVLLATPYFEERIMRGLRQGRKGYAEIFSRFARRFINLSRPKAGEIKAICEANGIPGDFEIKEIIQDSDFDLRRVERLIHKKKILAQRAATQN